MANSDKNIRITPNRGTTSFPKIVFTGQSNDPITVNVLDDNSLSFSGSAGQLFSLSNNISTGTIFSVNDISGFPAFRINANGNVSSNEFSGNFGIGISNPFYKFQVIGNVGISGGVALTAGLATTSSSSGTLVVTGGASVGSSLSIGGSLLLWNGANYTAFRYTGTATTIYTLPASSPAIGTSVLQSDTSGILSWVPMTATGSAGGAGTVNNSAANLIAFYPSAGTAVTGNTSLSASGTGLTIGFTTVSTGTTTGALTVAGGVGIGGSLNVASSSQIASVIISGNTITGNLTGTATTATYANQAGYGITSGSANSWTTPRTLNLSGDLSGSVIWSGSGDTTLSATIVANSVALGTDTTGQYASTIAISGSGITATAANADDGTTYTIYSSATSNNTASSLVFRDGSGNFSAGTISANLSGTATTATYSHQAGYAITSGSSALATTATYSHQSGYGITAGSASIATTATYSHQAGYAITSGSSATATTATYSHQAGYAITSGSSGTATSATYANQAGYAITAGSANAWTTPRTLNLSGDLSGSVVWSGSGDTTITATINANSVALGTDTTGQYASTITISGSGITATASNADDATGYTIYSSATASNIASSIVLRDGSGNFSAGTITGSLSGTASTATYANQAGYGLTAGSSATATTATYSHQSGYAITSGSSSSSAIATTASNLSVSTASNNIFNPILFSPQGTGSGVAVSSLTSFGFNPTSNILNVSGVAITASTASTSTTTGALVVTGGVGIGDSLYVASAIVVNSGANGLLFQRAVGASLGSIYSTNVTPSTSNYSFATDGNNLNLNSQSNIFLNISNTVKATLSTNNFAVNINVASTSPSTGSFTVSGGVGIGGSLFTGTSFPNSISGVVLSNGFVTSGTWAGSTITAFYGGTGLQAGSFVTGSLLAAGSLTTWLSLTPGINGYFLVSNGTSALPSYQNPAVLTVGLATTATYSHQSGYAITSGSASVATTATYSHQSGYGITSGSASIATTSTYSHQSGYAITSGSSNTSGLATTATNINVSAGSNNIYNPILFTPQGTGSGVALSSISSLSFNPTANILNVSGLAVTATTASTSTSSGALIVNGGVGIGGSLYTLSTLNSSISGVNLLNGFITSGTWAGSTITAFYGGTGIQAGSFVTGSLLAAGSLTTWLSINPGTNGFFLVSNGASVLPTYQNPASLSVGLATTATYSHQSGYGITAGSSALATTSTYSHQSGYAITSGNSSFATTASNINVASGTAGTLYFIGTGISSGSGLAVSSVFPVYYNFSPAQLTAPFFYSSNSSGDEGGEIVLNKSVTNTTLNTSITIDINQNRLRFFETGGTNRGFYLDISTGGVSAGTNIMGGSSSGTVNSGIQNQVAYYAANGNAVSGTSSLQVTGTGVTVGFTTLSTSSSTGALTVAGGAGIAGSVYIAGEVRVGTNTFTKNYSGDINLDNGTADTPGIRYYWQNNRNFGNDVYYSGSGSTRWRVVREMGETGGSELFSIDREGVVYINNPGSGVVSLKHTGSGSATYTFPNTAPATGTSVLQSDTTGVLSWVPMTAGGGSGSVNNSAANLVAFYPSAGTAVTGNTSVSISGTGLSIGFNTNSTSSSTGALTVAGGAGIAGTLWANVIGIGLTLSYTAPNLLASFASSVNSYNQVIIQNRSNGTSASADFVLNNDSSTDSTFFGNLGMNSSGFTGSGSFNLANAVYLSSTTGDLVIGSTTANLIRFVYSSGTTDTMQISGTGVSILPTTNSTSVNTGALIVSGSVGIAGSIFIGNQITQTFNPNIGAGSDHAYFIQSSPLRTSIGSLIQIGTAALWDGATAGFFTGSANGTYIGINAATGTTASAIDFQIAGATRFQVGSGGSTIINNYTEIKAPDTSNKALRILGFSSATQGDILSFEHPAGGSFNMNGNFAGQAGGRFTIIASGNSQVRAATFAIQASDTKTVLNVDATSGAGALSLQNATNLQLYNSTNAQYAGFRYTGTSTTTYTLPASAPGAGTSVLQSDTAGNMSWVAMASGGGGSGTVTTLTAGTGVTFSTGTTITTTGTIRSKRHVNLTFCSGFTPVASGADTVVLRVPDSPSDGTTSLTYKPQEFFIRVETASATASTVQLEKYTGTGAFSGTAITSIGISGASTFERTGTVFAAAGSLLTSGDKLRINFTTLSASHANFSVYLLLEEV